MKSLVIVSIFLLLSVVAGARFKRQVPGFGFPQFPQFGFPQPGQPGTQTSFVSSSQTLNSRFGEDEPIVTGQQTVFHSTGNKFTQTSSVLRPDGSVTTNKQSGRVRRETKNEAKYDEKKTPESIESKQQIPPQQTLNSPPNNQQQPNPAPQQQQQQPIHDPNASRQQNLNNNQPHPEQQPNHPQQQPNYPQGQQPNHPQQQPNYPQGQQPYAQGQQPYPQGQPFFPQQFPFGLGYFGQPQFGFQMPFPQFGVPFAGVPPQQGVFIPPQGQAQGIQTGTNFDNRFGEETVSGGSQIITSNNGNYQITSTVLKPDGQVVTSQQSGTINNKKP